jgi:peptidoglycan/xylan/chitin deacetylase (PgdA/CDA1 family)
MLGSQLLKRIFGSQVWNIQTEDPVLFLTFDDGPIPEVTPWVLDELDKYNAKATFFCIGDNVNRHPGIYRNILDRGHVTGNHSYHHLNGWNTDNESYFADVMKCSEVVRSYLFRPPYGKIKPAQVNFLKKNFTIIMWDVLSRDYNQNLSGETCTKNVIGKAKAGSIVVFHDSLKARDRLEVALPATLSFFKEKGFSFQPLLPEFLPEKK